MAISPWLAKLYSERAIHLSTILKEDKILGMGFLLLEGGAEFGGDA